MNTVMKGIRFYQEFKDPSRRRIPAKSVCAVLVCNGAFMSGGHNNYRACYEAIAGVFDNPNSPVGGTSVSLDWLRTHCKRVSESRAREIHPALFERLDKE